MRYGSLCTGIGGIDLGLDRTGMQCVFQCEPDPFCNIILGRHWPAIPRYSYTRDIITVEHSLDMLCGGFPCQPHSVAGNMEGEEDDRNLWPEFIRLVRLFRPRWCLFENVPGIRNTILSQVQADLEREGYGCWVLMVGAEDVGAPHKRKRCWILAYSNIGHVRSRVERELQERIGTWAWHQLTWESRSAELADARRQRLEEHRGMQPGPHSPAETPPPVGNAKRGRRNTKGVSDQQGEGNPLPARAGKTRVGNTSSRRKVPAEQPGQRDGAEQGSATGLVDAAGNRRQGSVQATHEEGSQAGRGQGGQLSTRPERHCTVADAEQFGRGQVECTNRGGTQGEGASGQAVQSGYQWPTRPGERQHPWEAPRVITPESRLGSPTHGVPEWVVEHLRSRDPRVDRRRAKAWWKKNRVKIEARRRREELKALGNSVVPQCAELFGRIIQIVDALC